MNSNKIIAIISSIVGVVLINSLTVSSSFNPQVIIRGLPIPDYYEDVICNNNKPTRILDFTVQVSTSNNTVTAAQEVANNQSINGSNTYAGITLDADNKRYLINTVMNEVGGAKPDSFDGKPETSPRCNVACCILNRVLSTNNDFKSVNTVKAVILQKGQFSDIERAWNQPDGWADEECEKAVDYVLEHGDITGGSLFFMTPAAAERNSWLNDLQYLFFDGEHKYWKP